MYMKCKNVRNIPSKVFQVNFYLASDSLFVFIKVWICTEPFPFICSPLLKQTLNITCSILHKNRKSLTKNWYLLSLQIQVKWRPVLSGLILQFLFGLFLIRWPLGRSIFQCLANKVEGFLNFAKSGASFIYSDKLVTDGVFAFSVSEFPLLAHKINYLR